MSQQASASPMFIPGWILVVLLALGLFSLGRDEHEDAGLDDAQIERLRKASKPVTPLSPLARRLLRLGLLLAIGAIVFWLWRVGWVITAFLIAVVVWDSIFKE